MRDKIKVTGVDSMGAKKKQTALQFWAETFFEEKQLPIEELEIECAGSTHFIDTEFVQELIIKSTPDKELKTIKDTIVKIDFKNGDVNHYLKFLAEAYIKHNYSEGVES
jgi:hypothetical protein